MQAPFRVEVKRRGDVARLVLAGEFDIGVVQHAEVALAQLERDGAVGEVVLDLTNLSFIDSTGLRFILSVDARGRRDGFALTVVPGNDRVRRILRLAGVASRLNIAGA